MAPGRQPRQPEASRSAPLRITLGLPSLVKDPEMPKRAKLCSCVILRLTAAVAVAAFAAAGNQPDTKPWSAVVRDSRRQPIAGAIVRLRSG